MQKFLHILAGLTIKLPKKPLGHFYYPMHTGGVAWEQRTSHAQTSFFAANTKKTRENASEAYKGKDGHKEGGGR